MKVKTLIRKLKKLDKNAEIFKEGEYSTYGSTPDDVEGIKKVKIVTLSGEVFEGYVIH